MRELALAVHEDAAACTLFEADERERVGGMEPKWETTSEHSLSPRQGLHAHRMASVLD